MKPEELRLGNYVYDTDEKCYTTVELCDFKEEYFCFYEPIKLTEEILLKCGFLNWNGYYSKGDIKYEEENIILNFWSDDSYIIKGIKYLHQLQNLYYALCNEELKINL